ncbi:unnamed protein product [Phytophthora fragariaefolia]|uniref:Unnamed protein product n=1 Tax=Phytophthora fragariaefolia TaxID=1490495 RepID=A0A9W7CQK5_9STRA|nr:unnamed protein product [Phytophthora fragariaefolia]
METSMIHKRFPAAVAAIRQYWGSEHGYTDAELFAMARYQWESAKGASNSLRSFVLQVVGCRLEEKLLLWLMQFQASDAAEGVQTLVEVCMDTYFTAEGLELLSPMLDTLLVAAVVGAAACDRSAENRQNRMKAVMAKMDSSVLAKLKACSVVRALDAMNEDAEAWEQFLGLEDGLESRLFNSRSGRTFMDEAQQVNALQQVEAKVVFGEVEHCGGGNSEDLPPSADVLWEIAEKLIIALAAAGKDERAIDTARVASTDTTLFALESVTGLEKYLAAKESISSPSITVPSTQETIADANSGIVSAIGQLTEACSLGKEADISSELLLKVFGELSEVTSLNVLSIQASYLISLQMRVRCCFVDRNETAKVDFERQIRRVFNRLTGKASNFEHAASLVSLAAFCPGQVLQHFIAGARTDITHHDMYLTVLRTFPLLLDWDEAFVGGSTFIERELQQTLIDLSSEQACFDRESQNMIIFLLSLVGVSSATCSKRKVPVMTFSRLIDGVLNPLYSITSRRKDPTYSMEMRLNLYSLIQLLVQTFVDADIGCKIDSAVVESSFDLVLFELQSIKSSNPRLRVVIREKLLLLLKSIMELMVEPATITTLRQLDSPLHPSLWTLLGLLNNEMARDSLCLGLAEVVAIEAYVQASPDEESLVPIPLSNVISAVQVLLWGLLWNSMLSVMATVESTKVESWRLLDTIARYYFPQTGTAGKTVKGSLLIQCAVAEMMLDCGADLFQTLYASIIPYLLEYEPVAALSEEVIPIPGWAADKLPKQTGCELQLPCRLLSTHLTMRYVAKCWGLLCAANAQLTEVPGILLVDCLSRVLSALDETVTLSQKSLPHLLFCTQWLCFLVSAVYDLRLDAMATWLTVRTQSEFMLLRLLHEVDQLKGTQTSDAYFSQYFLAAWLAYLPAGKFEQVSNYLASKGEN